MKHALHTTYNLMMTPSLQQSMRILTYNHYQLKDWMQQSLSANFFLEEFETLGAFSDAKKPYNTSYSTTYDNIHDKPLSLEASLIKQIRTMPCTHQEKLFAYQLLLHLDERGFLIYDEKILGRALFLSQATIDKVYKMFQQLNPVGIGAKDVKNCWLAQLENLEKSDSLAHTILMHYDFTQPSLTAEEWSQKLKKPLIMIQKSLSQLSHFYAYPAMQWSSIEVDVDLDKMYPDIYIEKYLSKYVIVVNKEELSTVKFLILGEVFSHPHKEVMPYISKFFEKKDHKFMMHHARNALDIFRCLEYRSKMLSEVTRAILIRQIKFFEEGFLVPLTLENVAEDLGVHVSTVSRVVANKYAQTPMGVYPLKFFFPQGTVSNEGGEAVTDHVMKVKMKTWIQTEDLGKPLTDQQMVSKFAEEGVKVSRRTVAKYRDHMGLGTSSKRKK